jgi:hypothetical protein
MQHGELTMPVERFYAGYKKQGAEKAMSSERYSSPCQSLNPVTVGSRKSKLLPFMSG